MSDEEVIAERAVRDYFSLLLGESYDGIILSEEDGLAAAAKAQEALRGTNLPPRRAFDIAHDTSFAILHDLRDRLHVEQAHWV